MDAATEPGSHRWAVAVVEPARSARDTAHVSVWVGDGGAPPLQRFRTAVPTHLGRSTSARLLGWGGWSPVLEISGYAVPESTPAALRRRWLALPDAQPAVLLTQLPPDLAHENGRGVGREAARRPTWVEVRTGETLFVRTERDRAPLAVAVFDPLTGLLRPTWSTP